MTAHKFQTVLLDIDQLVAEDKNPNSGDVGEIATMIATDGWHGAVLCQEPKGRRKLPKLFAGEHRWRALAALQKDGWTNPAGEHFTYAELLASDLLLPPVGKIPGQVLPLADLRARRKLLGDNRAGALATVDEQQLADLLRSLAESEGLAGTGYDGDDLDDMLRSLDVGDETTRHVEFDATDRDEVSTDPRDEPLELPDEPITQTGDLWILGDHRLVCGDAFDKEDRDRLLDRFKVAMVVTDPPFAIYGSASGISSSVADDKMVRPFFEQLGRTIASIVPFFAHVYVCCDWRSYATLWDGFKRAELTPKNCLVWDKGNFGLGANWPNTHEFVAFFSKLHPTKTMTSNAKTGQRQVLTHGNILRYPRVRGDERHHNAAKPVAMLAMIMEAGSDDGAGVLDLFGGSGSTLIAAESVGRRCATMEMEPAWCDVICRRFQKLTGIKPERDGEAVDFDA